MTERVIVATKAGRARHIYHVDDVCDRLTQSETRLVERSKLTDQWRACRCCDDEPSNTEGKNTSECPRCGEIPDGTVAAHLRQVHGGYDYEAVSGGYDD
jgi:hypothetical protein